MKFHTVILSTPQCLDLLEVLGGSITDPIRVEITQPPRTAPQQAHVDFVKIARKQLLRLGDGDGAGERARVQAAKRACHIYLEIARQLP